MPLPPFKLPFPSKGEHNKDPGITSLLQKKKIKKRGKRFPTPPAKCRRTIPLIIRESLVARVASITNRPCQPSPPFSPSRANPVHETLARSTPARGSKLTLPSPPLRGCKWVYKSNISVRGVVRRTALPSPPLWRGDPGGEEEPGANNKVSSGGSTTRRQIFKFPVTRKLLPLTPGGGRTPFPVSSPLPSPIYKRVGGGREGGRSEGKGGRVPQDRGKN